MNQNTDSLSLNSRDAFEPDERTLFSDVAGSYRTDTDVEQEDEWHQPSVFITLHRYGIHQINKDLIKLLADCVALQNKKVCHCKHW
jgi:hypothetical protein